MINTYPDSEYVARAKLAVGDSWYAEGGSAGLAQAEIEYKDFITFFPNLPEAAEAQLKVANIHYRQMEKPDRDFTHAKRAEEEYKQLIQQFPDSKLVPEAKQRLREVQEVLAEREFRIGRFYYVKESWPAAIARFKSLTDTYPSIAAPTTPSTCWGRPTSKKPRAPAPRRMDEAIRAKVVKGFDDQAADAYDRILTRYPVMDAPRKHGRAWKRCTGPSPRPRRRPSRRTSRKRRAAARWDTSAGMMISFHRHPDVSQASKVGEPTLVPPKETKPPT